MIMSTSPAWSFATRVLSSLTKTKCAFLTWGFSP